MAERMQQETQRTQAEQGFVAFPFATHAPSLFNGYLSIPYRSLESIPSLFIRQIGRKSKFHANYF